jgi:transcriptional regulator with PAS, ATPase and Fis domain
VVRFAERCHPNETDAVVDQTPKMKKVLLTFTGFHDPFWKDVIEGVEQQGPILTALSNVHFDLVYLFATPGTVQNTTSTTQAIAEHRSAVEVRTALLDLADPTDYRSILRGIRKEFAEIRHETQGAAYYIATASGTPQMHAAWLLLAASGEIPAILIHTKPPRFIAEGGAPVVEIDLNAQEFPLVRPQIFATSTDEETSVDLRSVTSQLEIVGDDPTFVGALETTVRFADTDLPVLITGESGTGKEKITELAHFLSGRRNKPLRTFNCAALSPTLAESTLFGHKKGSFTGAHADQKGQFALAHGGTLFLDEFGELPLDIQAKLLRVLESGEIHPIGEPRPMKVDVRVIVATNKDLQTEVAAGRFREDLYYRVNVACVMLPPLRQRRDDIEKLAVFFVDKFGSRMKPRRTIATEALTVVRGYPWPGNVRQLMNTIRSAVYLCRHGQITVDDLKLGALPDEGVKLPDPYEGFDVQVFTEGVRRRLFDRALELSKGNQSAAARLLGITSQAVSEFQRRRTTS